MKMEKLHFCTLFDSNYLTRGLAMYLSLKNVCSDFTLYVIAFDEKCFEILTRLNLSNIIVISLAEFEDPELLKIKPTRTRQEYCWTCASYSILYTIKKYNLDMCTYIDADIIFFENPQVILDEMKESSVLLTEHRLLPGNKAEKNGIYCVQFMPFKNDTNGMTALMWWVEKCLEWCYARYEDGKFGDQKYLDDWATRFKGIFVSKNIGAGVAPWNMFRYKIEQINKKLWVTEKETSEKSSLIFYHFHSTKIFDILGKIKIYYNPYSVYLNHSTRNIYDAYEKYITQALHSIQKIEPGFHRGFNTLPDYVRFMTKKMLENAKSVIKRPFKLLLQ